MRSQSSFSTLYQYRSRTQGLFTSMMFSVIGDISKKAFLKLCSVFLNFSFTYLFLIISFISFAAAIWKYRISVHLVANRQSWQWSVAYIILYSSVTIWILHGGIYGIQLMSPCGVVCRTFWFETHQVYFGLFPCQENALFLLIVLWRWI